MIKDTTKSSITGDPISKRDAQISARDVWKDMLQSINNDNL